MTTIVIYFDDPEKVGFPLNHAIYYDSYGEFCRTYTNEAAQVFICRGDSYQGNMRFSSGWRYEGTDLVEVTESILADVIYMKGLEFTSPTEATDCIVNSLEFDRIGADKMKTYEIIGTYMPDSHPITAETWQDVLTKIRTQQVVLKPTIGAGGRGIIIGDKDQLTSRDLPSNSPYFAQDFIDTSAGIPGLVTTRHDLRLVVINGTVRLCYIRIPKGESLFANISQGASARAIPVEEIPEDALRIAKEVDDHFSQYYPRVYTVDFMYDAGRPYVCEINPQPGFPHPTLEGEEYMRTFHRHLFETLMEAVTLHQK